MVFEIPTEAAKLLVRLILNTVPVRHYKLDVEPDKVSLAILVGPATLIRIVEGVVQVRYIDDLPVRCKHLLDNFHRNRTGVIVIRSLTHVRVETRLSPLTCGDVIQPWSRNVIACADETCRWCAIIRLPSEAEPIYADLDSIGETESVREYPVRIGLIPVRIIVRLDLIVARVLPIYIISAIVYPKRIVVVITL